MREFRRRLISHAVLNLLWEISHPRAVRPAFGKGGFARLKCFFVCCSLFFLCGNFARNIVFFLNAILALMLFMHRRVATAWSTGLSLTQKKKIPVQNGVISKEPADSTCLHPGVPNCSTMSP